MKLTESEFRDISITVSQKAINKAISEGLKPEASMILALTYTAAYTDLMRELFPEDENVTEIEITED